MPLWEEASGAASPGAARPGGASFLKTREKPTGEVRPLPRARNQVREPRRRETRAGGRGRRRAGYARKRDPLPVGEGGTMTATDPRPGLPRTPIHAPMVLTI